MTNSTTYCAFCNLDPERELIDETETTFAMFDKYPVSKGHALIISKRHCADYFELSNKEQEACWSLLNKVKNILKNIFNPDGYNIGINIKESAGQTVHHVHIHLIPRYKGDVPDPRGGIRGVIPDKKSYQY